MNDSHVIRSMEWLAKIQNGDGGWGMYDYHDSRIVTTAEAVTALAIAGVKGKVIDDGIDYLATRGNDPNWCKYTRHHAWIIYALTRAGQEDKIPARCFQALQRSHIQGAWGHESRGHPNLFATFLAVRALEVADRSKRLLARARQWVAEQSKGSYWTFTDNQPSYTATSYAVLALTTQPGWRDSAYGRKVEDAVGFLREGAKTNWPIERDPRVSGDFLYNFHHCSLSWVIMALLAAGVSVFDPVVVGALDQLYNGLYYQDTGGWSEEAEHRPSVFATSHATAALEKFYNAFSVEDYLSHLAEAGPATRAPQSHSNNVFVVHGHDTSAKYQVARFLEQLGCKAIILDEQVDSGLTTIFQMLTQHAADVSYAIVLLTPDDLAEDATGKRAARARQNVILELGLFLGKLGAERVCLAKRGDVDIPTDVSGVLYLNLDDGGWKLSLARKLKRAGLPVAADKLI